MTSKSRPKGADTCLNVPTEATPDTSLLLLLRPHTREIIAANRAVENIFGAAGEKCKTIVGKRCHEMWGFKDGPCPWCTASKLWETGESQCSEVEGLGRSWEIHWVSVSKDMYFHYAHDISSQRQVKIANEKQISQLQLTNRELEQYAYTVAHDLKSPLITISGFVGVLQRDLAKGNSDEVEENLGQISKAADRMASLLDSVLKMSRLGQTISLSEDIPLGTLVGEVLELFSGRLESRGIAVRVSADLPLLRGDRRRLGEVLQNLLENSVKYMGGQPEPYIEIGSRRENGETVCFVRDNGMGIAPEDRDRTFELFGKLDEDSEGSGLGLAIVRRIVEAHEGRIWIESEGHGKGATFCFVIPTKTQPGSAGS